MLSQRWNPFCVCSANDEICSTYAHFAQCAMKFILRMLSINLHVKTVHILPLGEHVWKFVPRMLSVWGNCFRVCSACACYNFWKLLKNPKLKCKLKSQIKMQKPFRNPSKRTKVNFLKEKFFLDISPKIFGSAYAQSLRKCSNFVILAIIWKRSEIFFRKFTKGI